MSASFWEGVRKSAFSGALMSGIFYTLAITSHVLVPAINLLHFEAGLSVLGMIGSVLTPAAFMIGAVALFGGIMAAKRVYDEAHEHSPAPMPGHTVSEPARTHAYSPAPVLVPVIAEQAEPATQTPQAEARWAERTGRGHRDRIQEILAQGGLTDKDRATALLAEREAMAAGQAQAQR